jgi:hypothetical protein
VIRRPRPGPPATSADLHEALQRDRLIRTELPRVREAAAAWRNGLGALLAALIGFGLIKGRNDLSQLTPVWSWIVGVLLSGAFLAGAVGALLLLRAAHGRPRVVEFRTLPRAPFADHYEALESAGALRRGIALTIVCAAFLVAAVGTTWYGPSRNDPQLRMTFPGITICGSIIRIVNGTASVKTTAGEVSVDLGRAKSLQPVASCSAS